MVCEDPVSLGEAAQLIGGWFLVASGVFAYYAGMALIVNSAWERIVLPIGGAP